MKRTRRIEVVRYTRRVTWGGDEGVDVPEITESQINALLLEALSSEPEESHDCAPAEEKHVAPAPRRFHKLKGWLRRG